LNHYTSINVQSTYSEVNQLQITKYQQQIPTKRNDTEDDHDSNLFWLPLYPTYCKGTIPWGLKVKLVTMYIYHCTAQNTLSLGDKGSLTRYNFKSTKVLFATFHFENARETNYSKVNQVCIQIFSGIL